jgi:hypothetical protein
MAVPRPRPKLMAIGDSLAQGCRSLTVSRAFCAQSWPARLAAAQGWEFASPDHPRPVLFDLEDEVRRLTTLGFALSGARLEGVGARFRRNLAEWLAGPAEASAPCFDNVAVAGALVGDLYARTAASSAAEIAALTGGNPNAALSVKAVGDLHVAVNARFTLNPTGAPAFAEFTMLDWVRARLPETLLVQIGHNHGLYEVGARAAARPVDGTDAAYGSFWEQWARLAGELAALPPEVGTIAIVLLPKVGAVANLRAHGPNRTNGYADAYDPVFAPAAGRLTGAELAAVDAQVRAANERVRALVLGAATATGTAARVRFVDAFALFDAFDFKNSLDPARRLDLGDGVVVDNRYLEAATERPSWFARPARRWVAGGLQSADGMHPTGCGYALFACEVMAALGLPHDRAALLRRGFAEDRLLSEVPGELGTTVRLLGLMRELDRAAGARAATVGDGLGLGDALQLMRQAFIR